MKMSRKRWWWIVPALVVSIGFYGHVFAGSLEPTAPPGPTMHTLEEIYQKLQTLTGAYGVQATGQTTSYAAGDDGALQKGSKTIPRFKDNGNGTVTDNLTGFIWLKNANYLGGTRTWTDAMAAANSLANGVGGLTDGSVAGDWRLPNVRELHSLVDYGRENLSLPEGHPFTNVQSAFYWSSTTLAGNSSPVGAWAVDFSYGYVVASAKYNNVLVWCVRGGS